MFAVDNSERSLPLESNREFPATRRKFHRGPVDIRTTAPPLSSESSNTLSTSNE